jgi:hypothetical protein
MPILFHIFMDDGPTSSSKISRRPNDRRLAWSCCACTCGVHGGADKKTSHAAGGGAVMDGVINSAGGRVVGDGDHTTRAMATYVDGDDWEEDGRWGSSLRVHVGVGAGGGGSSG